MSDEIDRDAKLVGIDENLWKEFKKMSKTAEQEYLPGFLEAEAKARESKIDNDAWFEHKRRLAMRWFAYYRKAKTVDGACKIGTQYNKIACMLEKDRNGRS